MSINTRVPTTVERRTFRPIRRGDHAPIRNAGCGHTVQPLVEQLAVPPTAANIGVHQPLNVRKQLRKRLVPLNLVSKLAGRSGKLAQLLQRPRYAAMAVVMLLTIIMPTYLFLRPDKSYAATAGPNSAVSSVDNAGTGTVAWTNPGNATASDGLLATQSLGSLVVGHYLFVTNFGFSIPAAATISGISVDVQESAATAASAKITDNSDLLIKAGATTGTSQATTSTWPASSSYITYGGSANLWGATLAPSDINATNFGVAISAKNVKISGSGATLAANIDHVRITVTYTVPYTFSQNSYGLFNNQDTSAATTFATTAGGTANEYGYATVQTSDGGYAVAGITQSYGNTTYGDGYLSKYTATGTLSWMKTFGTPTTARTDVRALVENTDGSFMMTGTTILGAGGNDAYIARFSSTGSVIYFKTFGGTLYDIGYDIKATSDGGWVITGATVSYGAGGYDAFLAKFDSSGALTFMKTLGATTDDNGYKVVQTSDNGFIIVGSGLSGSGDAFFAKFNASGTLLFYKSINGGASATMVLRGIVSTADGGFVVAGQFDQFGGHLFAAKYDLNGAPVYANIISNGIIIGNALKATADGGYAVLGDNTALTGTADGFSLTKFTSTGALSWANNYPSVTGEGMTIANDGGYVVAGETSSGSLIASGGADTALYRTDSTGAIAGCGSQCVAISPTSAAATITYPASTPASSTPAPSLVSQTLTSTAQTPSTKFIAGGSNPIDVGTPLAATNTAATVPGDNSAFRLRMDMNVATANMAASGQSFKLQYAPFSTSCAATPTANYVDVNDTTTVAYYNNPVAASGNSLATNANDPVDGANVLVRQTYLEAGTTTFTNTSAINVGQDGMWDFALTTKNTLAGTHYCLRIVKADNTLLNTYNNYPEIIIPPSTFNQASYRWFKSSTTPTGPGTFVNAYGSIADEAAKDGIVASDGGYVMVGYTNGYGSTNHKAFITKVDNTGTVLWSNTFGDTLNADDGNSVTQTTDGGYVMAGSSYSYSSTQDAYIVKYNSSGVFQYSRNLNSSNAAADQAYGVSATSDGGVVIAGTILGGLNGSDAMIAKYDSAGTLSWMRTYDGSAHNSDNGVMAIQTSDGGYALSGTIAIGTGLDDFVAKFDSAGTFVWASQWGNGAALLDAGGLVQASDGGLVISGDSSTFSSDASQDMYLLKFSATGAFVWAHAWGGSGSDYVGTQGHGLIKTADNGYALTGYSNSLSSNSGAVLIKFDSTGTFQWVTSFFSPTGVSSVTGSGVMQATDGSYAVAGYSGAFGAGGIDMMLIKYDASGNIGGCATKCVNSTVTHTGPTGATAAAAAITAGTTTVGAQSPVPVHPSVLASSVIVTPVVASAGGAIPAGAALASLNTPAIVPGLNTPFRLRMTIGVLGGGLPASGQAFKLQFAAKDGTCAASSYADVTTTTALRWYDNTLYPSGAAIGAIAGDPTDGANALVYQTYQEANNFTNSSGLVYAGQDGIWDFSLIVPTGSAISDFCVRAVTSTGGVINSYSKFPEIQYGYTTQQRLRTGQFFSPDQVLQPLFTP